MTKLLSVTLNDVARAAGLSSGGTSYALRGHPSIPPSTVERVRQLAREMGYRPDPRISSLMSTIRRSRPLTGRETLAFIWLNTPSRIDSLPIHLQHYVKVILKAARHRAEQLGAGVDEFWPGEQDMTTTRLNAVLRSRGISGVIVAPAASTHEIALDWDWHALASVVIGNTDISPVINRSAHYHYRSVWQTLQRLSREGFSRPAAILSEMVQGKIHRMQHAAFVTNHPTPSIANNFVRFSESEDLAGLRPWLKKIRPDALILGWQVGERVRNQLQALVPRMRRIVTLDWHPHGVLPGIDPCNEAIAANAVDIVLAQLHRNERGLAANPTTMLLDGVWRESW